MTKKQEYVKVMRMSANGLPVIEIIKNELSSYQKMVGGLIEVIEFYFEGGKVLCIINEEGKLNQLEPNFAFEAYRDDERIYYDIAVGDVLFVGEDGPEFRGLSDDEIAEAMKIASIGRQRLYNFLARQKTEAVNNG